MLLFIKLSPTQIYFYPQGSKEQSDSRWRPALQGRGGKSGRGNYSSHTFSSSNGIFILFCHHKILKKTLDAIQKTFGVLLLHRPHAILFDYEDFQ